MMEEKIINEETEEVLENTASSIPEELQKYLEKDESTLGEIENVLSAIDEKKDTLSAEKEESEKNFEDRLNEFKEMLAKEKEDAFNEFAKREQDLDAEKARIEEIKLEQQGKQVNYIDLLKEISDKYSSKINSIEEAIKACEDNDTLTKALEEEKEKLEKALEDEYNTRKQELEEVLVDIGLEEEKEEPSIDPNTEINLDFRTPEEIERDNNIEEERKNTPVIEPEPISEEISAINTDFNVVDDNEVIEHESRKDVITEIYQSKDVMEGHVFPYLNSIK
ncbi:MAG: hypothetical protein J6O56_01285 [Bacilli bacterium]|nr:hypothetical protein [Bacilli bacterium]